VNTAQLAASLLLLAAATVLGWPTIRPLLSRRKLANASPERPGSFAEMRASLVDQTTQLVEQRNGGSLRRMLERSGSHMRVGEWVLIVLAILLVLSGLSYLIGGIGPAIMVAIMVPLVARTLLVRKIDKRQEDFADQLPDLLQNLSSSLRSGQSLPQAVASIAPELHAPASEELKRVVIENRIGRDLIVSFEDLASRMNSIDFDWVVRAIDINYRTGGDLSVILRRLDSTIRARNHVAGTVRSLTAEGRMSGLVLTALPPIIMLAVMFINPEFLEPLFETAIGRFLLGAAVVQLIVGSIWLSRMARFKF